jgi:hypothetical protein
MTSLAQLAKALGGEAMAGGYVLAPGPGHSPKDRSMTVMPKIGAPDGFLVKSFASDNWQACKDHVMARLGHARRQDRRPAADKSTLAIDLWNKAQDPGITVRDYHARRGLVLPDDVAGRVVRWLPRCPWGQGQQQPAMLLAFRSIATDQLTAIHRVALASDGSKIGRMMLGPVGGAAIKIDADHDVEQGLAIGEGYETCMAGRQLGFRPAWALGSAGAIGAFGVLSGIDALTILGEVDDSGTNDRCSRACAARWINAGCEASIVLPLTGGDVNDLVMP